MSKIYCNISSFNRKKTLLQTIKSIHDQCDVINVALNNYEEIPEELYSEKINLFITDNTKGDAYKFLSLKNSDGYYFTMDDDLIYNPNYVKKMISEIEKYERKNIITLHGRYFRNFPINSYYNETTKVYHFAHNLDSDVNVQVGGTGVMAFHTDLFKVGIDFFEKANMADIWIAFIAKKNSIPITCVSHNNQEVIQQEINESIYGTHQRNDSDQTKILNFAYDKKILSFIIPVRKNPTYLIGCLNSILENINTDHRYEILVGIDGCETVKNSLSSLPKDLRISYFYFDENLGPYVVRNSLVKIAQADFVFFFDSDDLLLKGSLENILSKNFEYDIFKVSYKNFENENQVKNIRSEENTKNSGEGVFIVNKEKFTNLNGFENWFVAADSDFHTRSAIAKYKTILDRTKTHFARRLHPESLTWDKKTGYDSELRSSYTKKINSRGSNPIIDEFYTYPCKNLLVESKINKISNFFWLDDHNNQVVEKTNKLVEDLENQKNKKDVLFKILNSTKNIVPYDQNISVKILNNNVQEIKYKNVSYLQRALKMVGPNMKTKKY